MITEDYVSFETAKLLKEKGFDESCFGFYTPEKELHFTLLGETNSTWLDDSISAPTLQMAVKWLREKHRIFLNISYIPEHFAFTYRIIFSSGETKLVTYVNTYEEAYEAAIKYCLENLI